MSLDAMKQALTALEEIADEVSSPYDNKLGDAILDLRAAIEHAERPMTHSADCWRWHHACARSWIERNKPTAPRQWQGLTEEEVSEILDREIGFNSCFGPETDFARAIEAKLKENNHA